MEKRLHPRIELNGSVKVWLIGDNLNARAASVTNLTEEGLLLHVAEPMSVGEAVQVDAGEDMMVAEVRHCKESNGQFAVGLHICDWVDKGALQETVNSFYCAAA